MNGVCIWGKFWFSIRSFSSVLKFLSLLFCLEKPIFLFVGGWGGWGGAWIGWWLARKLSVSVNKLCRNVSSSYQTVYEVTTKLKICLLLRLNFKVNVILSLISLSLSSSSTIFEILFVVHESYILLLAAEKLHSLSNLIFLLFV